MKQTRFPEFEPAYPSQENSILSHLLLYLESIYKDNEQLLKNAEEQRPHRSNNRPPECSIFTQANLDLFLQHFENQNIPAAIALLPNRVELATISLKSAEALTKIEHPTILEALYTKITTATVEVPLTTAAGIILEHLVSNGYVDGFQNLIKSKLDFSKLSLGDCLYLRAMILAGEEEYVISLLPQTCDLNTMTHNAGSFLSTCVTILEHLSFSKIVPSQVELTGISSGGSLFLSALIRSQTELETTLSKISFKNCSLANLNTAAIEVIKTGVKHGCFESEVKMLLESYNFETNTTIQPNKRHKTKMGPTIHQQIKMFPLHPDKNRKHGDTTYTFRLLKNDVKASGITKIDEQSLSFLMFNHKNIHPRAIEVYKKAKSLLPIQVVGSSYYDQFETNLVHTTPTSYREVYAGPALHFLDFESMPAELAESILIQKNYITLFLLSHNIDHGHPSFNNFCVYFVIGDKSNQSIMFDINDAWQVALENNQTLKPIVVLRDWDLANYLSNTY